MRGDVLLKPKLNIDEICPLKTFFFALAEVSGGASANWCPPKDTYSIFFHYPLRTALYQTQLT